MAIPSVVNMGAQPGGGLVSSLNALNNLMQNNIKTEYAPYTAYSDAASKLAYARLMGPQFLAKLMGNPHVVANNPKLQDPKTGDALYQAGMGAGAIGGGPSAAGNALNNMPVPGQSSENPFSRSVKAIKNALWPDQTQASGDSSNALLPTQQGAPSQPNVSQPTTQANTGSTTNADSGMGYDKNGNNVRATPQEVTQIANQGNSGAPATTPSTPNPDQYAENAAHYDSIIAAGKELGTARGKTIAELGEQQLALSNSGVSLDRIKDMLHNPTFQTMRSQIPFFQDKQLSFLSKVGTPEQQKLIGDFISTAQAFKIATINSFKGKTLEKEFNLADKIKFGDNDTMGVMLGKLDSLATLKEIGQAKNDMVIDLMTNKNMDEGRAVRETNKLVKTKDIEKQVDSILNPPITIMYKNNQKYHIPNDKVESAKKAGYSNGR